MVMKDKLQRNNHKKAYFYLRDGICIGASIFGAFVLLAVPISIARSVFEDDSIKETSENTQNVISSVNISNQTDLLKY